MVFFHISRKETILRLFFDKQLQPFRLTNAFSLLLQDPPGGEVPQVLLELDSQAAADLITMVMAVILLKPI